MFGVIGLAVLSCLARNSTHPARRFWFMSDDNCSELAPEIMFGDFLTDLTYPRRRIPAFLPFGIKAVLCETDLVSAVLMWFLSARVWFMNSVQNHHLTYQTLTDNIIWWSNWIELIPLALWYPWLNFRQNHRFDLKLFCNILTYPPPPPGSFRTFRESETKKYWAQMGIMTDDHLSLFWNEGRF